MTCVDLRYRTVPPECAVLSTGGDVLQETAGCDSLSRRLIGDKSEVFAEGAARNLDPLTVTITKIIFKLVCTLQGIS